MKFEAIRSDTTLAIPVSWKCSALGVTEQGYYAHCRRKQAPTARDQADAKVSAAIGEAHRVSRQTYGTPRLKTALHAQGYRVSRRRIARLRSALGLAVKRKKKWIRTTDSRHTLHIAPNRLDRNFLVHAPDTAWVSDITYLRSGNHWLYLCTILDLFGNVVVGRKISDAIDSTLVTDALAMAIRSRSPKPGCIFHSDRGSQYASDEVRALLDKHGFAQSMSRKADCWDNAVAESSFSRLKAELGEEFESDAHAVRTVYEYLDVFHNHIRIHSRLNTTPTQFENHYWKMN